jgi:hypothetical protein
MLALDADAPKPPAYPFVSNSFKEREDKLQRRQNFWRTLPSCLQNFVPRSAPGLSDPTHLRFRVCIVSVRRSLEPPHLTRKRKNEGM